MKRLSFVLFLVLLYEYHGIFAITVPELIESEGYPVEQHFATTKSGYILGLHRIPEGKIASVNNSTKSVVLLQHGFATSSDCWVLSGRKSALGYLLADKGYDVWLANTRGTVYSTNHTQLNLKNSKDIRKFNKYSFHEKGNEDLLTTIDYILEHTGQENLALYAHSEGASMFFAMGATQPKQLKKINSFYGFAPLVFIGNTTSPVAMIYSKLNQIYLGGLVYDLATPYVAYAREMLINLSSNFLTKSFTTLPIAIISGGAQGQIAGGTISKLYQVFPSFVNKRSLIHLLQLISSKKFREYDLPILDPKHLLKPFPKKYNLKKVNIPMYLYFSPQDLFINVLNLKLFDGAFERKPKISIVHNEFGHYDFVYGKDAFKVYELTYKALENHTMN